jgi:ribosomal protein L40E
LDFEPIRESFSARSRLANRSFLVPLFLNVRCPSCQKNYRIDTRDIKSSEPHFECLVCQSVFGFMYPPASSSAVQARVIRQSLVPLEKLVSDRPMDVKTCAKCTALNAKGSKECRLCGVNFDQIQDLPLDPALRARPSLKKAWKDLMTDYSNVRKHLAFMERCEDLEALPFALKKYQDLKATQPHDNFADEMLHRVWARSVAKKFGDFSETLKISSMARRINWIRAGKLLPWISSTVFLVVGFSQPAYRNLAGVGAALLFITLGLHLMVKGRITFDDFW